MPLGLLPDGDENSRGAEQNTAVPGNALAVPCMAPKPAEAFNWVLGKIRFRMVRCILSISADTVRMEREEVHSAYTYASINGIEEIG